MRIENPKDIIREFNVDPKKSLGQNFLLDANILQNIATAIDIQNIATIEVGPGIGNLSQYIYAQNPSSLDLVELDGKMVEILQKRTQENDNITIHHQDVLKFSPAQKEYQLIGNIPYYITSAIIFHFLYDVAFAPKQMVFLMARDVAEKILETKEYGSSYLSKFIGYRCEEVKFLFHVKPHLFYPAPKVESSVLLFTLKPERNEEREKKFLKLLQGSFAQRRKKLSSNLVHAGICDAQKAANIFEQCQLGENARAQELSLDQWQSLFDALENK